MPKNPDQTKYVYLINTYTFDLGLNNLQWLIYHKTKAYPIYLMYMNKQNLALNNLQGLICHKNKPNQTKLVSVFELQKHFHVHFELISYEIHEPFYPYLRYVLSSSTTTIPLQGWLWY